MRLRWPPPTLHAQADPAACAPGPREELLGGPAAGLRRPPPRHAVLDPARPPAPQPPRLVFSVLVPPPPPPPPPPGHSMHKCMAGLTHTSSLSPLTGAPAGAPAWHVCWAGGTAGGSCLEVPVSLARAQGLAEGTLVALRALPGCPAASAVSVEPANADDWEQVELNAGYMEEQLLNQVGNPLGP